MTIVLDKSGTSAPDFSVVAPFGEGWILETLAEALIASSPLRFHRIPHRKGSTEAVVEALLTQPANAALGAIFAHHIPLMKALERRPAKKDVLFFGHYFQGPVGVDQPPPKAMAELVQKPALIWTNAACWDRWLVEQGVDPSRISRIVRAVDCDHFQLRDPGDYRKRMTVGLVSQYHPRKNEAFIREAILRRDDLDWILLGRNWRDTPGELLRNCLGEPNFEYIDTRTVAYDRWPAIYRRFDIFATPSLCEGGPFPLLEAMACGAWPIASDTGFAAEMIEQGRTGRVHAINDTTAFDAALDEAIAVSRASPARIREAVLPHSWQRFGAAAAADLMRLRTL